MSDYLEMREHIKKQFSRLVNEDSTITSIDPLNEMLTDLNNHYISTNKYEHIKPIDKSFILGEEDIVPIEKTPVFNSKSLGLFNPYFEHKHSQDSLFEKFRSTIEPKTTSSNSNSLFGEPLFPIEPKSTSSNSLFGKPLFPIEAKITSKSLFTESLFPTDIKSSTFTTDDIEEYEDPPETDQEPEDIYEEDKTESSPKENMFSHFFTSSSQSLFQNPSPKVSKEFKPFSFTTRKVETTPFTSLNSSKSTGYIPNPFEKDFGTVDQFNLFQGGYDDSESQASLFSQFGKK